MAYPGYGRDWVQITLDMIAVALWPTSGAFSPTYAVLAEYTSGKRLKGTTNLAMKGSANKFPMIGYEFVRSAGPVPYTAQRVRTDVTARIKVARFGFEDIDGSVKPARWLVMRDIARIQEAIGEQAYADGATNGPFGIKNGSLVTGQGTGTLYGTLNPTFADGEPYQDLSDGSADNLGPNVWMAKLLTTIPVIHN